MTRRDGRAFQYQAKEYFETSLGVTLIPEFSIHLDDGQTHKFDLATPKADILIECKSITFTETGNDPPAKLNHAKTDALLLKASHAHRKLIVFDDDIHPKKGSLAGLFARRNKAWIGDVEVWRHWQGKFEMVSESHRA